jgi:alpha-tubulin suppressor-like RCC1 family protein
VPVPYRLGRIIGPVLGLVLFASAGCITPGFSLAQEAPAGLDSVVAVATTGCASLALRADGTVWGWGCNSNWNLGATAPGGDVIAGTPIQAEGLDQVRGIAFGDGHGLAVRADGTVWGWGLNDHGQVGVPLGENCPHHAQPCVQAPVPVPGLSGVKAVAATGNSSFALTADGTVWAWGANGGGELGTGDTTDSLSPIRVEGLTDISQVSGAATHVTALRGDGTVWSWGAPKTQTTPTQVSDLEGVVAVAAGLSRDLALTAGGTVWAWGEEGNPAPAAVAGLGPVTAIVGGGLLSGAMAADGTVWVWGTIAVGPPPSPPTPVKDLTDIVALAMGTEGNLALQADGTVWVWNQYGKQQQVQAPAAGTPMP